MESTSQFKLIVSRECGRVQMIGKLQVAVSGGRRAVAPDADVQSVPGRHPALPHSDLNVLGLCGTIRTDWRASRDTGKVLLVA